MNFPNATEENWTAAQRIIRGLLSRHGIRGPDADDAIQEWSLLAMTRQHRTACPVSPTAAAVGARYRVARHGIGALTQTLRGSKYRPQSRQRIGVEEPQPDRDPLPVVNTAPAAVDPATAAEIAEGYSPARVKAARRAGMTPAAFALAALGWGPLDEDDAAKATPAVPQCGPGYTPPTRGARGVSTATDPGRRSPPPALQPLDGENLRAYRAELAAYYAR